MQTRKLGASTLEVSALGLGCMGMSFGYGPPADEAELIQLIHAAVSLGITFFDAAQVYGPFLNETLLGKALSPIKNQVVIAAKFSFAFDENGKQTGLTSHPDSINRVAEASLQRLNIRLNIEAISTVSIPPPSKANTPSGGANPKPKSSPPSKNSVSASSPLAPSAKASSPGKSTKPRRSLPPISATTSPASPP